tara:strand:- start:29913 stop:30284 length:372 start_codon:yes stop_codon:yes gene_type:complete
MDNTSNTISVNTELEALGIVEAPDTPPELLSGGIILARESMLTGQRRERYIPGLTIDMLTAWKSGELIQDAMPNISAEDREFIMTGIVPAEWGTAFPEFLDDEDIEWDTDDVDHEGFAYNGGA